MSANLQTRLTLDALEAREVPAPLGFNAISPQPEPPRALPAVQKPALIAPLAPSKVGAMPEDPVISKSAPASFNKILLPALRPIAVSKVGAMPEDPVISKFSTNAPGVVGAMPEDPFTGGFRSGIYVS